MEGTHFLLLFSPSFVFCLPSFLLLFHLPSHVFAFFCSPPSLILFSLFRFRPPIFSIVFLFFSRLPSSLSSFAPFSPQVFGFFCSLPSFSSSRFPLSFLPFSQHNIAAHWIATSEAALLSLSSLHIFLYPFPLSLYVWSFSLNTREHWVATSEIRLSSLPSLSLISLFFFVFHLFSLNRHDQL